MGLPSKALRKKGFTLIEVLTVLTISSLLLTILALVFKAGLFQVSRSSGRIEVVRIGRQALNNVQRYLASTVEPNFTDPDGEVLPAIYWPHPNEVFDPNSNNNPAPKSQIAFFTPVDHLNNAEMPSARQLQENPISFAHSMRLEPGHNGRGQDLILERLQPPNGGIPSLDSDLSQKPRYLARGLGVPDSSVSGGFRDGFVVRRYTGLGSFQFIVNVSGDVISDSYNRNTAKNSAPIRVSMRTIYQPPIFNVQ